MPYGAVTFKLKGMENIVENNKLLAEFLNIPKEGDKYFNIESFEDLIFPTSMVNEEVTSYATVIVIEDLKFHYDWNWLMKVVEKIESLGMYVNACRWIEDEELLEGYWCTISDIFTQVQFADSAQIKDTESKIEATYIACVEFVKWYNQNK